jgi:parvulin-like peptidyl-prolyl isomerase/predicted phosphatase
MTAKKIAKEHMKRVLIGSLLLWPVLSGCRAPVIYERDVDKYNYVVASAGSQYSLTMPQLYEMIANSELLPHGGTLEAQQVKAFLDSVLCDTLASLKANELLLDQYFDYYRIYKERYKDLLVGRYLNEVIYSKISVDSQEVVDFYYGRPDLFSVPEQVYISHILISSIGLKNGPDSLYFRSLTPEELEKETAKYAYQIRRLLDFGEEFSQVALKYSHDKQQAAAGGDVGWTPRGHYYHPFDSVAFSMKPGEISQPYQDQTGWHIIYVEDYRPEGVPPLDEELYQTAKLSLEREKGNKLGLPILDSLFRQIQLVYNEELLDTNVYLADRATWAAIVNNQDTINFFEMSSLEEPFRRRNSVSNTTVEMKKEMLRELAKKYAVAQAARNLGLDTLPEAVAEREAIRRKYAKQVVLQDSRDLTWSPPESLIEKYYNGHIDEFFVKKPLKVQHIVCEDSMFAELLRDQALAGVDFIELAKQYYPGEPSIRADLANLGEINPEDVPPEFYQQALLTPVGQVSHPVKTQYGYHIIKVLSRADSVGVDQVRHKIIPVLRTQHDTEVFNKFRDQLYAQYKVRFPRRILPVHLKPSELRSHQ